MRTAQRITFLDGVATSTHSFIKGKTYLVDPNFADEMVRVQFAKVAEEQTAKVETEKVEQVTPVATSTSSASAKKKKAK